MQLKVSSVYSQRDVQHFISLFALRRLKAFISAMEKEIYWVSLFPWGAARERSKICKEKIRWEFMTCVKWNFLKTLLSWPKFYFPSRERLSWYRNSKFAWHQMIAALSQDTSDTDSDIKLIKLKPHRSFFLSAEEVFRSQTNSKLVSCSSLPCSLLKPLKHSTALSLIAKLKQINCSVKCIVHSQSFISFYWI